MAESQKEAASTSKSQKKVLILDDEFGNDFLGSWKSMAVAKDDGLDFGAEVASKGKKNAFDFDKLDMDFSLDGDFGSKLSSFKVDMVDLDFSSPPKKPAKPKEKSAKETNHGGKQDRFSFSFNFDELDNFDLDSSLMKTEKKSDKVPDDKLIGSPGNLEKNQSPRRNLVTSADALEDGSTNKLPEPQRLATSKVDPLIGKNDTSLSVSTDLGRLNASHDGMRTIPEKEIRSCTKVTSGHSDQSERMVSTEPNPQETIQDSSMRSVSNDDSIQDVPELQVEVCSSATEVISNQEEEQDINGKKLCNMECSPTNRSKESTHNEFTNKLENQTSVPTGDINMDESVQGDTHTEDASVAIATVDMLSTTATHENKSISYPPVAPLHSDPKSHKLLPMELKDTGNKQSKPLDQSEGNGSELNTPAISNKIKPAVNENRHLNPAGPRQECNAHYAQSGSKKFDYSKSHVRAAMEGVPGLESDKDNVIHKLTASENKSHKLLPTILMKPDSTQSKPLSQSGANESQLNTAAIPKKINHLLNKIEIAHSNPTDARKEINVSDVQAGSQKIDYSNLHDRAVTKGVPDELGSNKDNKVNKLSASFKVHSAGLMEQKFETKTFKGLNSRLHVSSIPAIQNSKSTSVEGNKLSPLEADKKAFNVTSAKLSRPATPKTLLQSNLQTEAKSLQRLDRKAVMRISPAAKLGHAGTPTMKRKISEVPKEYPVNPVKRITGSPLEERDSPTTYEKADNKRVRNNENLLGSCYFSPTSDIRRRDASMKEFEVPLLMEDDGIVEKAEACAKELDNICNILKKKHEEAKEILVRAVVNNNNLLMLNHPVHEEKIQMVHRLASRLSRELQI